MSIIQASVCSLRDRTTLVSFIHPLTKRKVRKTFYSATEADEYKIKLEKRFSGTGINAYRELSIEDLIILFLREKPKNKFFKARLHVVDLIETFGHLRAEDMNSDMLRIWLDQIQKENNLTETSMCSLKCTIDMFFAYLEEKEIISESPLREIFYKRTVPSIQSRNILPVSEIEKLLYAIKLFSPGYLYPIIRLFAETGAKVTEVLELKWSQLDFEKRTVHFYGTSKSRERTLPISEELTSILEKRRRTTGLVFQTYYREPFTRVKLSIAVNEFKRKGTYKGQWTVMDLRHSFAVNFLANGGSLHDLQMQLGHWNVFDTKKLYGGASI
ncbi:MAG: tyrosine-type recombinase/integrase [Bdellovibrionales bacterium]